MPMRVILILQMCLITLEKMDL